MDLMGFFGDYPVHDERILAAYSKVKDKEVKKLLSDDTRTLCGLKFVREHEKAFRDLLPKYFDLLLSAFDKTLIRYSHINRRQFAAYMCLELGIVDPADVTTVKNFSASGLDISEFHCDAPRSTVFLTGLNKRGGFSEKDVIDFIDGNPEYLLYFMPLLTAIDSECFANAIVGYLINAGLQDTLRYHLLLGMLKSSNAAALKRFTDIIEENNLYRLRAMNEVAVYIGNYAAVLPPKEVVPLLRDAAVGNAEKYLNADFRHAYYFIHTYDRVQPEAVFNEFAQKILSRGGVRARWALLRSLSTDTINGAYARQIFSSNLTIDDFSFLFRRVDSGAIDEKDLPVVFESLFGLLLAMNKVSYHFKTDEDVSFARDLDKWWVVGELAVIADRSKDKSYTERLDNLFDGWREDAQAKYLEYNGDKTRIDKRAAAVRFLKTDDSWAVQYYDNSKIVLTYDEAVVASDYLKSKKQDVKSKLIKEFLRSADSERIAEYLCGCAQDYKVQAGEEMQDSAGKVSKKKLDKATAKYSRDSESVFEVVKPQKEIDAILAQKLLRPKVKPISFAKFEAFWRALEKFRADNADYEYETNYEGTVTLGSTFRLLKSDEDAFTNIGFSRWPLGDKFKQVIEKSLTRDELKCALIVMHCADKGNKKLLVDMFGGDADKTYDFVAKFNKGYFNETSYKLVDELCECAVYDLLSDGDLCDIICMYTTDKALSAIKSKKDKFDGYALPDRFIKALTGSDDNECVRFLLYASCVFLEAELDETVWLELTSKAYEQGLISGDLVRYFVRNHYLSDSFVGNSKRNVMRPAYSYKKFRKFLLEYVDIAFEAELKRGVLQTPYSNMLLHCKRLYGAKYYVASIAALRGLTWVRSPYDCDKGSLFSAIIKMAVKADDDSYEKFVGLVKEYNLTKDELIKAALFNPEFVDYTEKYLGIPGLKLAMFWFVAHLNETLYGEDKDRREQQIKQFSDISYPDFQDGAFDYRWYKEMTDLVPAEELKRIYNNAKYVTVGGLHKRAQRFFDAVGGKIQKQECLEKINGTRNKDYCLVYSLIPIADKDDLLERYGVLMEFVRSSKQFGAQRQASERRTVDIALENLARAAGYTDTDVFIFEMESQTPSDIYRVYNIGEITVTPYIDGKTCKISYTVQKDGKIISAVPSKYAKDATLVGLRDEIKALNKKLSRIKFSLEKCMVNRVRFTAEQIRSMCREPIIAAVIGKLILLAGDKLAVVKDGEIFDINGERLAGDDLFVAHPVELKKLGLLPSAIEYVVRNNIVQPFKQALREIYIKSDEENTQDEVMRFNGFSVDVKKCVAALKGKGWGVSEDIGLRKVYYKTDTVAAIFREFDLFYTVDFEDVNRELNGIFFFKRKDGEIIPLKEVDDVVFSETLRDVDLMISISSNVVYDFELAKSTVEIRQEILKSIVAILKLNNVSFLKDNIKVQGRYGTYIINIRTGLVFKEGKGNLLLDTVYSVDKPLLLDFIDEDPLSADIISKAVVLSADEKITDPKLLFQIKD
ncbi:MAG: DUF4132 domain-containing protein [Clostridiales bacterium]|nr:DUF4132 domain-containing protein [Clostridiales bacterium]